MNKRLTKGSEPILGGVASGFSEFFNIDPLPIRLLLVAMMFLNVFTGIAYIVCWIVLPQYDGTITENRDKAKSGLAILGLGILLLLRNFFPQLTFTVIAACALIGLGLYLIIKNK